MSGHKYCIGCDHLHFTAADPGYDTEYTGGIGAEDASFACGKGRWHEYLNSYSGLFAFEKAMESAASCPDYEERS